MLCSRLFSATDSFYDATSKGHSRRCGTTSGVRYRLKKNAFYTKDLHEWSVSRSTHISLSGFHYLLAFYETGWTARRKYESVCRVSPSGKFPHLYVSSLMPPASTLKGFTYTC
uniref:Secreted protein n=1 Tax=Ascaris lumbricoides TaxID=6252 RepID=A0A0M3I416_ASCLU